MLQENLVNYNEANFKISYFEVEKVKQIIQKLINAQVEADYDNMRKLYREMFKRQFGHYPNENFVIKFFKELAINNKKLGVKRTKESILEAMNKSLK
ncbi:MAG: hypothetical protein GQ564_10310 [Bacteroidales bacterium]|nr:hypothetical protein [Bacteroidales bacterium]